MEPKEYTADDMYGLLCKAIRAEHLRDKVPEAERSRLSVDYQMRVTSHVRAKTGHNTLPSYHGNGASEDDKRALYKVLIGAVMKRDFSGLAGGVSAGQVDVEAEDKEGADPRRERPAPGGKRERSVEVTPAVEEVKGDSTPDLARMIAAAIAPFVQSRPAPEPTVNEDAVRAIVAEIMDSRGTELAERLDGMFSTFKESFTAPPRQVIEVRESGGAVREVKGAAHRQLPQVVAWVQAGVPVWLWGQAGAGKTFLFYQIAEVLRLTPTVISVDPTMTVGKLLGYRNLANGEFVEGFLYRAFRDGGLVGVDEVDTGDPGILATLNALIANDRYLFPNGETVARHPDFRMVAGANSKGTGATAGYVARNRLDAATLDRFAVIELVYDTDLEFTLATGEPVAVPSSAPWQGVAGPLASVALVRWVEWVQRVRARVGTSVLISPRASILGCRALRVGVPAGEVAEALVFRFCSPDTKQSILGSVGGVTNE